MNKQSQFVFPIVCAVFLSISACSRQAENKSEQLSLGEQTYIKNCKVCHAQGINGAPILGNKKMWAKRVPQGVPTLIEHAINGYGLMPGKGGNTELTTAEISAVVNYMVEQIK